MNLINKNLLPSLTMILWMLVVSNMCIYVIIGAELWHLEAELNYIKDELNHG